MASFNLTQWQVALMGSPFILLFLASCIAILASNKRLARLLLYIYAIGLVLMYLYGEPWRFPAKLSDEPFVQGWYATAWLDLILLPILIMMSLRYSARKQRDSDEVTSHKLDSSISRDDIRHQA